MAKKNKQTELDEIISSVDETLNTRKVFDNADFKEASSLSGKITIYEKYTFKTDSPLSNKDVAQFLMSHNEDIKSPGQAGRILVTLKYLGLTELDYNSMAAIVSKYWSLRDSSSEVKTTGKSLASIMNGIKHNKIDISSSSNRGGSSRSGNSRTISDEDIDAMFAGLS